MSREDRLPIFPTRGALVMLKTRMSAATKGYVLLKRKSDAMQFRFRTILADLITSKIEMGEAIKEASFSLAELRFVTGEMIGPVIIETASKASTKLRSWDENIAGVKITVFESYRDGNDAYELAGLSRGGQQLSTVKKNFANIINLIVKIASLQTSFVKLDDALRLTNMRIAAIEHIVLPKFSNTLNYIESELEEFDREDFYRIKKIKEKKTAKEERRLKEIITPGRDVVEPKCTCHQ